MDNPGRILKQRPAWPAPSASQPWHTLAAEVTQQGSVGPTSAGSVCKCERGHDTGECTFAVVSQRLRHPGVLPGGGGPVILHCSAALGIVGVAPGPAPHAVPAGVQFSQDLWGQGSCSFLFMTLALWLQRIQGCCWEDLAPQDLALSFWR